MWGNAIKHLQLNIMETVWILHLSWVLVDQLSAQGPWRSSRNCPSSDFSLCIFVAKSCLPAERCLQQPVRGETEVWYHTSSKTSRIFPWCHLILKQNKHSAPQNTFSFFLLPEPVALLVVQRGWCSQWSDWVQMHQPCRWDAAVLSCLPSSLKILKVLYFYKLLNTLLKPLYPWQVYVHVWVEKYVAKGRTREEFPTLKTEASYGTKMFWINFLI